MCFTTARYLSTLFNIYLQRKWLFVSPISNTSNWIVNFRGWLIIYILFSLFLAVNCHYSFLVLPKYLVMIAYYMFSTVRVNGPNCTPVRVGRVKRLKSRTICWCATCVHESRVRQTNRIVEAASHDQQEKQRWRSSSSAVPTGAKAKREVTQSIFGIDHREREQYAPALRKRRRSLIISVRGLVGNAYVSGTVIK